MVATIVKIKFWDYATVAFVTIVVYTWLLIHIMRNGANSWLAVNTALVLISGIAIAGVVWVYYELKWMNNFGEDIVFWNAFTTTFQDGCPPIVHYLLAMKYQTIATDMPAIFDESLYREQSKSTKFLLQILWILNLACGPIKGLCTYWIRHLQWVKHEQPTSTQATLIVLMSSLNNVCNLISGVILVNSVRSIRSFFRSRNDEDELDTSAMALHASCFILYLVATVIFMITYALQAFWPTAKVFGMSTANLFTWNTIFYYPTLCLSNLLLAYIFYDILSEQIATATQQAEFEEV